MMRLDALISLFPNLEAAEVSTWIERRWVQPEEEGGAWVFHEIDVARIRLIRDLRYELDVSEEAVPLVLALLDQVYDLRCALKAMSDALKAQPREVQEAVFAAIERRD